MSKRTRTGSAKATKHNDAFILKHFEFHPNQRVNVNHKQLLKRHVFISLLGLYQTWKQCPVVILYTALAILPVKRKWIYHPLSRQDQAELLDLCPISLTSDTYEMKQFIELLRFKDRQGLLFCMFDEYADSTDQCPLILPVWYHLNQKLMTLYDAVTGTTHNALHLDVEWYQNKDRFTSKYGVKAVAIMTELYFCTLKFKNIQEIIYQSNPDSLIPVMSYQNNEQMRDVSAEEEIDIFESFNVDEDLSNWWVSDLYDPHAL